MLADVPLTSIVRLSLILLALVFVGWVTVWQVRRRMTRPDETSGAGFTLSDLRQLHKSGQMSDAEFERAKAKVVDVARKAAERDLARAAGRGTRAGGGPAGGGGPRPPRNSKPDA